MTPFQTAILSLVTPLVVILTAWLQYSLKERQDERRARQAAAAMAENTVLTAHAGNQAAAAYKEANDVNLKIAASNLVAGAASDRLSELITAQRDPGLGGAEPVSVVISNPEPVPVTVKEPEQGGH